MTTKDQRTPILGDLLNTAREAREAMASKLYDDLRPVLQKRAREGFDVATIAGPAGLDLRGTAAALAAETWLRDEGLAFTWDPRTGAAEAAGAVDLVVTWRKPPIGA